MSAFGVVRSWVVLAVWLVCFVAGVLFAPAVGANSISSVPAASNGTPVVRLVSAAGWFFSGPEMGAHSSLLARAIVTTTEMVPTTTVFLVEGSESLPPPHATTITVTAPPVTTTVEITSTTTLLPATILTWAPSPNPTLTLTPTPTITAPGPAIPDPSAASTNIYALPIGLSLGLPVVFVLLGALLYLCGPRRNKRRQMTSDNASTATMNASTLYGGSTNDIPLQPQAPVAPPTGPPTARAALEGYPGENAAGELGEEGWGMGLMAAAEINGPAVGRAVGPVDWRTGMPVEVVGGTGRGRRTL